MSDDIVIEVPDENQPGYLKRLMAISRFEELRQEGHYTPEYYESLITFMLGYVTKPADRDEAREALMNASSKQYIGILDAIMGKDVSPTSPELEAKN